MTSMTVRDMRLHWPKAEKTLAEGEGDPHHPRFQTGGPAATAGADPIAHARRMQRFWKNRPSQPSTDVLLAKDRHE